MRSRSGKLVFQSNVVIIRHDKLCPVSEFVNSVGFFGAENAPPPAILGYSAMLYI